MVDCFLMTVPDRPVLAGYQPNNPGLNGWSSNSIFDWVRNYPEIQQWTPDLTSDMGEGGSEN